MTPIDVWNVETFDAELMDLLSAEADMVRAYMDRDLEIFRTYENATGPDRPLFRPSNIHAAAFMALEERVMPLMAERTIRAWHYTRLTDAEAEALRADGVVLSTIETLKGRLAARVQASEISQATADAAFAASPFHSDERGSRSNKFWMVSHPVEIEDGGVEPLMAHWGGEVAHFWLKDADQLAPLATVGKRSIVELAVPVAATDQAYSAAEAVVAAFGRSLGCIPESRAFDLFAEERLPGSVILAVHRDGDPTFDAMARGYPAGYVDVRIGWWEALTGEKD
nr:hypothetical protein [Brevundimonas diminuta]